MSATSDETRDGLPVGGRVFGVPGLQSLIDVLAARGFAVVGPVARDGAIAYGPVQEVSDLPIGWGDEQSPGSYRLRRRDDDMVFGFAAGAQSPKAVFFPARDLFATVRRHGDDIEVEDAVTAGAAPYAILGMRSCDVAALGIHDTVLLSRVHSDASYAVRRGDAFVVAVTCSDPGGTCFCVSMGSGPSPVGGPGAAYDLALTEVLDDDGHRFVVEAATDRGAEVLVQVESSAASDRDRASADLVAESAAQRMGRTLDTTDIKELLYDSVDSPMWDEVATRCLSCSNCTMVCPTCFCTDVQDVTDLTGSDISRERVWDSCFDQQHSYLHGGSVRRSTKARYRQWMTHKLASWIDQFGSSGCVGCGRCISWCPAGIDITAQVAALREERES